MDLKLLAEKVSEVYAQNSKIEAVLLGGSVSRKWNDEHSDIELFLFWKEPPTNEDRKNPIQTVKGKIIDFHPFEDEEWSETYVAHGVKFEISSFLTSTIKKILNAVVVDFDIDFDKQCLAAAVHDGIPLYGINLLTELKNKVKDYPKELSIEMIKKHIDFGNRWNNRDALLERQDWLMLYSVIVSVQTNLMAILFGLNRQYVHHPAFKWQRRSLETMTKIPKDAYQRLSSILLGHPRDGINEMEKIIEEVFQLITNEYPLLNLSDARDKALFLRPKNE